MTKAVQVPNWAQPLIDRHGKATVTGVRLLTALADLGKRQLPHLDPATTSTETLITAMIAAGLMESE